MSLKKSLQGITKFSDLIEFIGRDLEYENLSDQIKDKDFWNGVGNSKELLSDGREVVRITQIPEDGKEFSDIKRHLRNTGPEGRELLNIIVYTDDESKITGEVHFMYHARNPRGETGIEYDLKYFSVNPKDVSPVYYEYLKDIKVNGRSITDLENEESDDSLLDTFSVDKITNSFYDDFHNLIQNKLEPSITNLPENVSKRHYSQLLTNRILFILFIQEKEWLSTENNSNQGQTDYLEQKYVEVKEQKDVDLWNDFFKKLFFNGLSKKGSSPDIVGTVPYLNGGLFEKRDYEDEVDVDTEFFEALLSPEEVNSFGEKKGFLRNYKISLSESNPSEQELVVDPEFIGRVFEMSMQDTEERGEKGAFYTPKDITQYMSKNSIKQLLLNELPEKEEEISQLVLSHEIKDNFTEEELQTIHDELKDINVLDPAVGSGAFIIAVMEELVGIFEAINPEIGEEEDTYDLKEHMIANNLYGVDIDQAGIELCKFRTWLHLMQDLEVDLETLKEQNDKYALPNLDFKFFVGNSLSGDYKPIEAIDEIKNAGYQKRLDADQDETDLISKIEEKRRKFTETHDQEEKKELESEIKDLTDRLENSINWADTDYYMKEVVESSGDDFKWSVQMPEVMADGGFDIVIANPPYQGQSSQKQDYVSDLSDFFESNLEFYETIPRHRHDLYEMFIMRGWELTKENSVCSYITSRTFLTIGSRESSRKLLQKNNLIDLVIANDDIFDATVDPSIFTYVKNKGHDFNFIEASETGSEIYTSFIGHDSESRYSNATFYRTSTKIFKNSIRRAFWEPKSNNKDFYRKYMSNLKKLEGKWKGEIRDSKTRDKNSDKIDDKHIYDLEPGDVTLFGLVTNGGQGLATGKNREFLAYLDGSEKAKEIKNKNSDFEFVRKNENGVGQSKICRVIRDEDLADLKGKSKDDLRLGLNEEEPSWVPIIKGKGKNFYKKPEEYIDWSSDNIESVNERGLIRNRRFYFEEGLFIARGGSGEPTVRYGNNAVFSSSGGFYVPQTEKISAKYLNGLMNSKLIQKIIDTFLNHTVNTQISDIRYVPIKVPTTNEMNTVEKYVDRAINRRKKGKEIDEIKQKIDQKIEQIYGVELDG